MRSAASTRASASSWAAISSANSLNMPIVSGVLSLAGLGIDGAERAEEACRRRGRSASRCSSGSRTSPASDDRRSRSSSATWSMTTASPDWRISLQIVVATLSSPPGTRPKAILSTHAAGDPAVLGDPGDRGKAHAGDAADDVKDGRNGADAADRVDIVLKVVRPRACPEKISGTLNQISVPLSFNFVGSGLVPAPAARLLGRLAHEERGDQREHRDRAHRR